MRNVEIKAKIKNITQLIKRASEISGNEGEVIEQHDTFFKVLQGRLKLRKFETGNGQLIYYERADAEGPKLSSYKLAHLDAESCAALNDVLSSALGVKGVIEKRRRLFLVGQTRIHADSVNNLGDFAELEVVLEDTQSAEEGQIIAKNLMQQLGIQQNELISGAYMDLLNNK